MDSINYEIIDDLKYKLREKSIERDKIKKSIIPTKEYAMQTALTLSIIGMFAAGLTFVITHLGGEMALLESIYASLGVFAGTIPLEGIAVAVHEASLGEKYEELQAKDEEIEKLVQVIKEIDKKDKKKKNKKKNDLLMGTCEKKIIREEDFLDYYIGYIPEEHLEEPPKQKSLGSINK